MEIRFTQSARKHRIGKAHAKFVIRNYEPTFVQGDEGDKDKVDLEQWLGCVYFIAKKNNPNFKIIFKT